MNNQEMLLDNRNDVSVQVNAQSAVKPSYNITVCDTLSVASDILWYQLIPHC
jgi:hypothetical protein